MSFNTKNESGFLYETCRGIFNFPYQFLSFQDKKDFTIQVKINRQNNFVYRYSLKKNIKLQRLYSQSDKFTVKVMVSAVIT